MQPFSRPLSNPCNKTSPPHLFSHGPPPSSCPSLSLLVTLHEPYMTAKYPSSSSSLLSHTHMYGTRGGHSGLECCKGDKQCGERDMWHDRAPADETMLGSDLYRL